MKPLEDIKDVLLVSIILLVLAIIFNYLGVYIIIAFLIYLFYTLIK